MPGVVGRGAFVLVALLLVVLLGRDVAAPATAQIQDAPTVPAFPVPVGPPPPGAAPLVALAAAPLADPGLDLGRLDLPRAGSAAPPPLPATGAIGTSNAYL